MTAHVPGLISGTRCALCAMEPRSDDYLAMSVENVWLVDPTRKKAFIADENGTTKLPVACLQQKVRGYAWTSVRSGSERYLGPFRVRLFVLSSYSGGFARSVLCAPLGHGQVRGGTHVWAVPFDPKTRSSQNRQ